MQKKYGLIGAVLLVFACLGIAQGQEVNTCFRLHEGDDNRLARCLLRPVTRGGNLGPTPASLPAPLDELIGRAMTLDGARLRLYLRARGITEESVGGQFVFRDGRFVSDLTKARYFVIHDTSYPELREAEFRCADGRRERFPCDMNEPSWSWNNLPRWVRMAVPTHVFVNRVGESALKTNFNQGVLATKYEMAFDVRRGPARNRRRTERSGMFINIELIQPRRRSRPTTYFDLAPVPGMTQKQLERLALLYVVASTRAGRWLLPGFHRAVDDPIPDAHDDPQIFDLNVWLGSLRALLTELSGEMPHSLMEGPRSSAVNLAAQEGTFAAANRFDTESELDFPEPTDATRGRRLTLFATFYHVLMAQNVGTGQPLLDINGRSLGVKFSERDWCGAAMEGTVLALNGTTPIQTFNFAGRGGSQQVNCRRFFPRVRQRIINALNRTRFEVAKSPFGTGVQGMILVPYRTIAVDSVQRPIPFGTVVFIPEARGKEVTLPSGKVVRHDGYFFAADTGGLIKGNHIDVFSGLNPNNPFPEFIKSREEETFTAFVINDPQIAEKLRRAHRLNP